MLFQNQVISKLKYSLHFIKESTTNNYQQKKVKWIIQYKYQPFQLLINIQ